MIEPKVHLTGKRVHLLGVESEVDVEQVLVAEDEALVLLKRERERDGEPGSFKCETHYGRGSRLSGNAKRGPRFEPRRHHSSRFFADSVCHFSQTSKCKTMRKFSFSAFSVSHLYLVNLEHFLGEASLPHPIQVHENDARIEPEFGMGIMNRAVLIKPGEKNGRRWNLANFLRSFCP